MIHLVILFILGIAVVCEGRIGLSFFGLSVSKGTGRSRTSKNIVESRPALYDEYGSIPQVQNTYKAISQATPVLVFRRENCTVIAYGLAAPAPLVISTGCNPYYQLNSPLGHNIQHSILLTGVAGDCRTVVRFAKQLVVNYTMEYSAEPSGSFLAAQVGEFLQSHLAGGGRMLACHCFIISAPVAECNWDQPTSTRSSSTAGAGTIYEVTAVGGVVRVVGGTAGGGRTHQVRRLLQVGLTAGMTAEAGLGLVRAAMAEATRREDDEAGPEGIPAAGAYNYFEIPDL